jgi:hypothetical protein
VLKALLQEGGLTVLSKAEIGSRLSDWPGYLARWKAAMVQRLIDLLGYGDRDEEFKAMIKSNPDTYFLNF